MWPRSVLCVLVVLWVRVIVRANVAPEIAELRPVCLPHLGDRCQEGEWSSSGTSTYKVDGHDVLINYVVGTIFEMQCDSVTRSVEHPALPRLPESVRVVTVKLWSCSPPSVTYAQALAALNITVTEELQLENITASPALRDDHFVGLPSLVALALRGTESNVSASPRLPRDLLAPLTALHNLILQHVIPGTTLESLPASLHSLKLLFTGLEHITPVDAPRLRELLVREDDAVTLNLTGAPALESLKLTSPNSNVTGLTSLGSLRKLGVDYWCETRPEPWVECGALEQLHLMDSALPNQRILPKRWVARCPMLSKLEIQRVPLAPLPGRLLENATALKGLTLSGCQLEVLPWDLFNDSVQLITLNLSNNRLKTLHHDMFFSLRTLNKLDLSHNLLTASIALALQPLSNLRFLYLAHNTRLSDLCDGDTHALKVIAGRSKLLAMTHLNKLVLRNTSVSRVCRDWREGMPYLTELDLTDTKVTFLKYEDIVQWRSTPNARMIVGGDYTVRLEYTAQDYEREKKALYTKNAVKVKIKSLIVCDCNAYWAAVVFQYKNRTETPHTRLDTLRCTDMRHTLRSVLLDDLTCTRPDLCTGLQGCSCVFRNDTLLLDGVATAHCESHGLTTIPGPLPSGHAWRLLLSNNSISSVNADDLPARLLELDLRNNTIKEFDEVADTALHMCKVHLENNPLRCDCDNLGLLAIIRRDLIQMENVSCSNLSKLASPKQMASTCPLQPAVPISSVLIAALVLVPLSAVVVLVALLTRSETRLRIKIFLERVGLLPPRAEDRDARDGWLFDAFVSHAHEDEEWVRATLVDRLEGGPTPYRLCVHYRNWAPGEWIPAQIAASVRASRRTLAVVSRHFLKSDWARLEFREAHAHARRDVTPRLVVLLLEDPALLPLDAEMRDFIENNTYVRWGDPWFWRKLERAMPPRPRKLDNAVRAERSELSRSSPPPAELPQQSLRATKPSQTYCSASPRVLAPPGPAHHVLAR